MVNKKVENTRMKKNRIMTILTKRVFNVSQTTDVSFWALFLIFVLWYSMILISNFHNTDSWFLFTADSESLRSLLISAFQGLASFFAITISVSLLVTQLAFGSFSPRLISSFFKNKIFLISSFLFLFSLSLNFILLSILQDSTVHKLIPFVVIDLILTIITLISIVPTTLELLISIDPKKIGLDLIKKFDPNYFKNISSRQLGS